jgi:ABC-type sugar transport system substrate-binding protein
MKLRRFLIAGAALLGLAAATAGTARAERPDDGQWSTTAASLKGKKVAYVPIAMGFDLTQAWAAALEHAAKEWGFEVIIRDPNWDVAAGVQALSQLIDEKPDMIVVQPADPQSYVRLLDQAVASGIKVVEINMKSLTKTDAYVGADWYGIASQGMDMLYKTCARSSGKSGKIALISGTPTNPGMIIGMQAINDKLEQYKGDLELVANQSADFDPTKAHAIAATLLKQHEDLCGFYGIWDGQDIGTAAAIKEAGKTGKVVLPSSGGGREAAACDNLANDNFTAYLSYDGRGQGRDLVAVVKMLLQDPAPPASHPVGLYSPVTVLTKDNLAGKCWTIEDIKAYGP